MYTRIDDKVVENFKLKPFTGKKVSFKDTVETTNPPTSTPTFNRRPKDHNSSCSKSLKALWSGFFFIILAAPFIFPQYLDLLKRHNIDISILFILHSIIFIIISYFLL